MPKGKPKKPRSCKLCGSQFLPDGPNAWYCHPNCQFTDHADRSPGHGPNGDCWHWTGTRLDSDYGIFVWEKRTIRAARFSFSLYKHRSEPMSLGKFVCHHCDNPPCVNPKHLFLSDHEGNMADMVLKRRARHGEKHPDAKLTENDVRAIRASYTAKEATQMELAEQYGVRQSQISRIVRRETWRHLDY